MVIPRMTILFRSEQDHRKWRAHSKELAGHHEVPADELFPPDYVQQTLRLPNFDAMLLACDFPVDLPTLAQLTPEEDARWDEMIRSRSGFNTWVDLFADATREWFYRKIDGEPIHHTRTPPASASPNSEEALSGARLVHQNLSQTREIFAADQLGNSNPPEYDPNVKVKVTWDEPPGLSLDYIPIDVVEELVAQSLAIPFERDGFFADTRVVVAPILDGKANIRNLVMLRRTELDLDGSEAIWKSYYRVVASPLGGNQNPQHLAEAFVFDQQRIELLESTAWWLDATLSLVPLGTLAKHIATGEGEILETTISTLGDLAGVGRILQVGGKALAVIKGLDVAGDVLEVTAAGYQAKKAIDLYLADDLSQAQSHALQATLRLLGYAPSAVKRITRRVNASKPTEPTRRHLLDVAGPPIDPKDLTGPNRGIFTTVENSSMSQDALDYQSSLPGAVTDVKTQKLIAPGLRYDNPNPRGKSYILFDGLDLYDPTTLIDRKLGIARSKKQKDTFRRWAEGLKQNREIKIRIEVPNQRVLNGIRDFIDTLNIDQIVTDRIRIVEVPID